MTFQASGSVTFEIDNLDQVGDDLAAEAESAFGSVTIPTGGGGGGRGLSGRQRRRARRMSRAAQEQSSELGQQTDLLENILAEVEDGVGGGGGGGGGGGLDLPELTKDGVLTALGLKGLFTGATLRSIFSKGLRGFGPTLALILGRQLDEALNLENPRVGDDTDPEDVPENARDNIEGGLDFAGSVADALTSGGGITPADEATQETFRREFGRNPESTGDVDLTGTEPADEETQETFRREFLRDPSQTGDVNLTGGTTPRRENFERSFQNSLRQNRNQIMGAPGGLTDMRGGFAGISQAGAELADRTPTPTADGAVDGPTGQINVNADVTVEQARDERIDAKITRATQELRQDILSQIERDGSSASAGVQGRFQRTF